MLGGTQLQYSAFQKLQPSVLSEKLRSSNFTTPKGCVLLYSARRVACTKRPTHALGLMANIVNIDAPKLLPIAVHGGQ